MTEAEAAAYLGVKQVTLHVARCSGRGPQCTVTQLDGSRLTVAEYRQEDLDAWRVAHPQRATAAKPRKRRSDIGRKRGRRTVSSPAGCQTYQAIVARVEKRLAAVRARR